MSTQTNKQGTIVNLRGPEERYLLSSKKKIVKFDGLNGNECLGF